MRHRKGQGFTVIELLIVLMVAGILAWLVFYFHARLVAQTNYASASQVRSIGTSLPLADRKGFAVCVRSHELAGVDRRVFLSDVRNCAHDALESHGPNATSASAIDQALAAVVSASQPLPGVRVSPKR